MIENEEKIKKRKNIRTQHLMQKIGSFINKLLFIVF